MAYANKDPAQSHHRVRLMRLARLATPLALANAALTGLILLSPIGIGSGLGMIGYSIYRLLAFALVQSPIAIVGIVLSFLSMARKRPWAFGLSAHMVVLTASFFFYFAQS